MLLGGGLALGMAYLYSRDRAEPGFYHCWNRGIGGSAVFRDDEDRKTFEWMINRYLNEIPLRDARGKPYRNLRNSVRLNARAVLTSHYHLILRQLLPGGIDSMMRGVGTSYTRYFHKKYGGEGAIFPAEFRARRIDGPKSFMWRVAYVHDNHKRLGLDYRFSTHGLYLAPQAAPSWLDVETTLRVFGGRSNYLAYMKARQTRNELDARLRLDR